MPLKPVSVLTPSLALMPSSSAVTEIVPPSSSIYAASSPS